jgi:uncharacterized protein
VGDGSLDEDTVRAEEGRAVHVRPDIVPDRPALLDTLRAMPRQLPIGTLTESDAAAPAVLEAARFNRHTFWCGQSGSGKTYALGVVLEQLLLSTQLPILILDPNGDFVRLGDVRDGVDADAAATLQELDIRVLRSGPSARTPLKVRFLDMPIRSRAAVLRLDPLLDRDEYNLLLHLEEEVRPDQPGSVQQALASSDDPVRHRLLQRLENLGVLDWQLWARGASSSEDVIDARPRATVLDIGGFPTLQESRAAALAVLDHLWSTREERRPVLIVIDEAHNICPPDSLTPVEKALTDRVIQIAAEGRKYGLWLLLSTQRPTKIHPNALTQCDNLGLMRMSSPRDLDELGNLFGYAPADMLAASPRFAQGQALFAGSFVAQPSFVQIGVRLTHEGGSDVHVPL